LNYKDVGTNLMVEIRGRKTSAEIVPLPFYKNHN
jgi:glycine cleavage system aminomethyltransferase T